MNFPSSQSPATTTAATQVPCPAAPPPPLGVAIQGYAGSFHQQAAQAYFGVHVPIISCATFREVAAKVEYGAAPFGVIAIENSIAGSIIANYRILQNAALRVIGEVYLRIQHQLMALPGTRLDEIREVHSHPMALLQCSAFLDENAHWRPVETADTALSAKRIAQDKLQGVAAIAGTLAAKIYGLEILAHDIHSIRDNYTRFMVLQKIPKNAPPLSPPAHANKASLYFQTKHEKGALVRVLHVLEKADINLTKLQSYPIPSEPWHYLFHVDMEFDSLNNTLTVLENMKNMTENMHIYGIYPKGLSPDESATT